jgi:hypothetical protein
VGNATAYGVGSILNAHYPQWLERTGRNEALFGTYLGLVFGAQTLMFLLLTRFPGWKYRPAPLVAGQLAVAAVVLALPTLASPAAILLTAPVLGAGLGTAYFASLVYSVESPVHRGRNAGVHEALLGLGSMGLPFLGGLAASASGRLEAPYVLGGGVGAAVALLSVWLLRAPGAIEARARAGGGA